MPVFLLKIALIIIIVRSVYVVVQTHLPRKNWLDVAFYVSVAVAALYFLI
ncbi:hypothetical protein [Cohnella caldifontis]|nr:hypothetical protein [Cohnella sp. YIM B05605]